MLHVQEHVTLSSSPHVHCFRTEGGKEGDSPHIKDKQGSRNQTPDLLLRGTSATLCTTVLAQGGTSNHRVRWAVRGAATPDPNR